MMQWTLRSLFGQRGAFFGSIAAIGAAFALVMMFEAIWTGEADQAVNYVHNAGADVWVMQRGVSNMHMASSLIRDWTEESVAAVEGVAAVEAIRYAGAIIRAGERDWISYIVGLEPGADLGGPWSVSEGASEPGEGEIIVPETMAQLSGIRLGDSVRIANRRYRIAGLAEGTFSMGNPVSFMNSKDVSELMSTYGYVSYVLVKAMRGVEADTLAGRIHEQVEDVDALPTPRFLANDFGMVMQMGVELIGLMTGISSSLAALLIAFTLYVHTIHQRRELAILKAVGFPNHTLYLSVTVQALVLCAAGFLVAVVLAHAVTWLTANLAPQITMRVSVDVLMKVAAGGVAVALVAALIPAWQVARVDPQTAFQS